eukprot:2104512-Pyramimonas_sp.AAC.1
MHEMGDYKTAKEKGEQQLEHLKALGFVDKWSDSVQLFSACRRGPEWGATRGGARSRGLAFPNKLWWRGPSPNSRSDKWQF